MEFQTGSKLLYKAIEGCVKEARKLEIPFRQSYKKVSQKAMNAPGRYAHARQMNRCQREVKRLKTYVGPVVPEIESTWLDPKHHPSLTRILKISNRLLTQERRVRISFIRSMKRNRLRALRRERRGTLTNLEPKLRWW